MYMFVCVCFKLQLNLVVYVCECVCIGGAKNRINKATYHSKSLIMHTYTRTTTYVSLAYVYYM